ncbi:MAG: site-specific integrase, partial [Betaproteobacteria bacterium]|nr:site-specific integrase [Betaproteobacteria bacterium]
MKDFENTTITEYLTYLEKERRLSQKTVESYARD